MKKGAGTTARFKDAVGPSSAAACPVGRETRCGEDAS